MLLTNMICNFLRSASVAGAGGRIRIRVAVERVAELEESNRKLSEELKVTEGLYRERQRVLEAIPECNVHGDCIPHALEWIEKMKAIELTAPDESRYVLPDHVQEALNSGDGIYRP